MLSGLEIAEIIIVGGLGLAGLASLRGERRHYNIKVQKEYRQHLARQQKAVQQKAKVQTKSPMVKSTIDRLSNDPFIQIAQANGYVLRELPDGSLEMEQP